MAPPALSSPSTTAMVCAARQGRLRQRYEGCYRLVSGCIPYMLKEEELEGKSSCQDVLAGRLQVLMISTPKRGDLIFPKGGWEDDESIDEAACRARRRLPRPLLPPRRRAPARRPALDGAPRHRVLRRACRQGRGDARVTAPRPPALRRRGHRPRRRLLVRGQDAAPDGAARALCARPQLL